MYAFEREVTSRLYTSVRGAGHVWRHQRQIKWRT